MFNVKIHLFKCPECKRLFARVSLSGGASAMFREPQACDCGSALDDTDRAAPFQVTGEWLAGFGSGMKAAKGLRYLPILLDELREDGILEADPKPGAGLLAGVVSPLGNALDVAIESMAKAGSEKILCAIVPSPLGSPGSLRFGKPSIHNGSVKILASNGDKFTEEWIGQGGSDTATLLEGAPEPPPPGIFVYEFEPVENPDTGGWLFPDGIWRGPRIDDGWPLAFRVPR